MRKTVNLSLFIIRSHIKAFKDSVFIVINDRKFVEDYEHFKFSSEVNRFNLFKMADTLELSPSRH